MNIAGIIAGGILAIAAAFTIANVIRLTMLLYREEIDIMRLVGATERMIRGPFLIEGILQGFIGAPSPSRCSSPPSSPAATSSRRATRCSGASSSTASSPGRNSSPSSPAACSPATSAAGFRCGRRRREGAVILSRRSV